MRQHGNTATRQYRNTALPQHGTTATIPQHANKAASQGGNLPRFSACIFSFFSEQKSPICLFWYFSQVSGVIQQCRRAGIEIKMLTGDNLQTAVAVARATGILLEQV